MTRWCLTIGLAASLAACATAATAQDVLAQDRLATARSRYAAARYEQALDLLAAPVAGPDAVDADRLRALCLLALGRSEEASQAIARVVMARPEDAPPEDTSPRVRSAFVSVRDRVLPEAAEARYDAGKAAFTRRDFAAAVAQFERALPLLEILALEGDREMESRRVLATDFLALARQLVPPPAEPARPVLASRPALVSRSVPAAAATPRAPQTPPVVLRQELPPWPHRMGVPYTTFRGAIEVRISDEGHVVEATIVKSIHPLYDQELLRAARGWRYEPAQRAGRAVQAIKRVEVELGSR